MSWFESRRDYPVAPPFFSRQRLDAGPWPAGGVIAAVIPDLMGVEKIETAPTSAETAKDLKNLGGTLLVQPPPGESITKLL